MNRKGLAPLLLLAFVAGIILLIVFAFTLFSSTARFIVIGIAILGAFVYLTGKALTSKLDNAKLGLLGIFLAVGLFFIIGAGFLNEQLSSGSYVNVPTFGYYECAPATEVVNSPWNIISTSGSGFVTCPSNSDGCNLKIKVATSSFLSSVFNDYRVVYQICNIQSGVCENQKYLSLGAWQKSTDYATSDPLTLLKSEKIFIDYQKSFLSIGWKDIEGAQYNFQYKPFILWRNSVWDQGRKEFTTIEQGCNFPASLGNDKLFISTTLKSAIPSQSSTSTSRLEPYKTRTFVTNFVPISVENYKFVTYNNQQAYCSLGNIYQIDTVTTNSGSYKVVNIGVNPLLADLDCCPGDTQPGYTCQNYKWVKIQVDTSGNTNLECSQFKPCPNSNWEIGGNKILEKYTCVENKCVRQTQDVECTTNANCLNGQTCDTKTYKCVLVPGGTILEDNANLAVTCDEKASKYPWLGYTLKTTTEEVGRGPLGIGGLIGLNKKVTTEECVATALPYYILGGFLLVLGISSYFLVRSTKKKRRSRR